MSKIEELVHGFNATPILFVGSGLSRRYLNLPDWKGLLEHFAKIINNNDDFTYNSYENKAKGFECRAGIMPKVAELIQKDYDFKWFADPAMRTVDEKVLKDIKGQGFSPFKAEIATFIKSQTIVNPKYKEEISKLAQISEKSIAGIITTNYDSFLEDTLQGFTKYIGQTELIFSAIQGIAEIYKIHGSVEKPDSIIINEYDYVMFEKKSAYLAAKLMTIFMEYPIIFVGYSIGDTNIQNILKSIVDCLDEKQLSILEDRFIFVEYKPDMVGVEISPFTIMINNKPLIMKKVTLSDFLILYKALEKKKTKLPVKILRRFKEELYNYTVTNMTTNNLRVAALDDTRVDDEELVLAIGKVSDLGLKGLNGIDGNEWYRDIIIGDLGFTADEMLEYAFPKVLRQNSGRLPVNKYLGEATKEFPECREIAIMLDFDKIISPSIQKNRKSLGHYTSVQQIWRQEKKSLERALRLMSHLEEPQIIIEDLENVLKEIFSEDVNVLQNVSAQIRTHLRRLILIYDYLKWGK
ncbi:SIR2 family protein [Amphibacillus indicireducens]|uniref:SIR2 family protein n=1 Tax=Amphibacillus indicireducens TaxID=1076330 RepID=A0ABP7W5N6_9BACI